MMTEDDDPYNANNYMNECAIVYRYIYGAKKISFFFLLITQSRLFLYALLKLEKKVYKRGWFLSKDTYYNRVDKVFSRDFDREPDLKSKPNYHMHSIFNKTDVKRALFSLRMKEKGKKTWL